MQVEIWSDVVCPWCYIGKRRFERALEQFPHRDDVQVHWKSFELDPLAPAHREGNHVDHLAAKYGMTRERAQAADDNLTHLAAQEGLVFKLDDTRGGNTFDAHRLIHLAAEQGAQDATKERLLAAYFTQGEPIGDPETLIRLVGEVGMDPAAAQRVLDSDAYADEVRADEEDARALGVSGVPFFVIDRRYCVSGAQPPEVLLQALEQAWSDSHRVPELTAVGAGGACTDEACAI